MDESLKGMKKCGFCEQIHLPYSHLPHKFVTWGIYPWVWHLSKTQIKPHGIGTKKNNKQWRQRNEMMTKDKYILWSYKIAAC